LCCLLGVAAEANAEHLLETVQHATPRDAVTWEGHPAARGGGGKLRVGYLGADVYRNVSSLMGLLREHDKSKVEVFCYLLGMPPPLASFASQSRDPRPTRLRARG